MGVRLEYNRDPYQIYLSIYLQIPFNFLMIILFLLDNFALIEYQILDLAMESHLCIEFYRLCAKRSHLYMLYFWLDLFYDLTGRLLLS